MLDDARRALLLKAMKPYCEEHGLATEIVPLDWFYSTDALGNYSFIFPFETKLDRANFFLQAQTTWTISILTSIFYVALVFIGRKLMSQRSKPYNLRKPLIIWNIAMALFSLFGFIRVSPELFRTVASCGFLCSVCMTTYGADPVAAFWFYAFVNSKFVELLDTAFIVLRKRPLIFLHWYHHVTVLLFAWHSAKEVSASARWYAWMNYGVHSIMYSYFALRAMGYRTPKWFRMMVTCLQISQMAAGVTISYAVFRAKTAWKASCHQTWANWSFAALIYASYFVLFLIYFVNVYVKPAREAAAAAAAKLGEKEGKEKVMSKIE